MREKQFTPSRKQIAAPHFLIPSKRGHFRPSHIAFANKECQRRLWDVTFIQKFFTAARDDPAADVSF